MKALKYLIIILFFSCSLPEYGIKIDGLYSLTDIENWIDENIEYKNDLADNWQTPDETFDIRTGDCEDKAILYMYLAKEYFGLDSKLLWTEIKESDHAIANCNGHYYYFVDEQNKNNLKILWEYSYEDAIRKAEMD